MRENITYLSIEPGVTNIGDYAFYGLTAVANNVIIPEGVTTIGKYAFDLCTAMPSVYIPYGVTSIGNYAFGLCTALQYVLIPYGVTSIGDRAFTYCTGMKVMAISATVTTIGDYAFSNCTALEMISNFAATPQNINANVFEGVNKSNCRLYIIYDEEEEIEENYNTNSVWNEFLMSVRAVNGTTTTNHYLSYDFPTGTLTITGGGNLPDRSTYVDPTVQLLYPISVNDPKYHVVHLSLPSGLTGIGANFFADYWFLTSVIIPDGVTYLNSGAFVNCYSLRSVTIPSSMEMISDSVFGGCRSLETVYNYAETPQNIYRDVFAGVDISKCTLYVPKGSKPAYEAADVWKNFVIEEIAEGSAVEDIVTNDSSRSKAQKLLVDGVLYILRPDGTIYGANAVKVR